MALSLEEYAALHPDQEAPAEEQQAQEEAKSYLERQEELRHAAMLKGLISAQITAGKDPLHILYTAISCIGLYAADPEWERETAAALESRGAAFAQQSLLDDVAEQERQALAKQQAEYRQKLRTAVLRQIRAGDKVQRQLHAVLDTLNETENEAK